MPSHHGNTPAAWSAVVVGLVGFIIGSVGLMISPINWVVFWVGVAVTIASGLVFAVLAKLGYNAGGH